MDFTGFYEIPDIRCQICIYNKCIFWGSGLCFFLNHIVQEGCHPPFSQDRTLFPREIQDTCSPCSVLPILEKSQNHSCSLSCFRLHTPSSCYLFLKHGTSPNAQNHSLEHTPVVASGTALEGTKCPSKYGTRMDYNFLVIYSFNFLF